MKNCKGNVLIYVLLGVVLLASLMFAISGENRGNQQNKIDETQINLIVSDILSHASALEMGANQMNRFGISYDEILFHRPDISAYNFNTHRQIYHPQGGGVEFFPYQRPKYVCGDDCGGQNRGWFLSVKDVEWGASDVLFLAYLDVNDDICSRINQKLHNEDSIYSFSGSISGEFIPSSGSFASERTFQTLECPDCENKTMGCLSNIWTNVFYKIAAPL